MHVLNETWDGSIQDSSFIWGAGFPFKDSGTQGFAHDSLIEHGPFCPQPLQVLDIGYWKWTQVTQCSLVMDLDAPWQEYKDQILYSALALEYEWQQLLWTDCIDKIICPDFFLTIRQTSSHYCGPGTAFQSQESLWSLTRNGLFRTLRAGWRAP